MGLEGLAVGFDRDDRVRTECAADDVLGDRDIPVIGNVNLGHAGPNIPLPLGVRAAVDANTLTVELVEAAVA